jgi:hypothetical protein
MSTSINISLNSFRRLSTSTQQEILALFTLTNMDQVSSESQNKDSFDGELTKKQVNLFLLGLSEKSKNVIKTMILEFPNNSIPYDKLLIKLDMQDDNMTGIWSGITKRSRTASQDETFTLIDWSWSEELQTNIGRFHPTTHQYLMQFFK